MIFLLRQNLLIIILYLSRYLSIIVHMGYKDFLFSNHSGNKLNISIESSIEGRNLKEKETYYTVLNIIIGRRF